MPAGRPCKICSYKPALKLVNRWIKAGWSDDKIAQHLWTDAPECDASVSSIWRHRTNHTVHPWDLEPVSPRAESGSKHEVKARAPAPKGVLSASTSHTRPARAEPIDEALHDVRARNKVLRDRADALLERATRAEPTHADVTPLLKKGPLSILEIAEKLDIEFDTAVTFLADAMRAGANIHDRGGKYHLDKEPQVGRADDDLSFTTDKDGTFTFAISTDQHLCSKYERLDCLSDFYDEVHKRGITTVLNAGNWIDGEATFNRHEIHTHGMDNQLQYLAREYPQRKGVTTYAIAGADHEGWYSRREGVDIGKYAENVMRERGREDWVDIGYVERAIPLKHHSSGKGANILVMHPGGGSAYATSYAPQKIVESFDGGEKPAALVLGHYHKADYTYIRNVHTMQGGCFQDQSLFMRSKRLSAHLGGCFVKLTVDPRTGAFIECSYIFRPYYVKEYYNGRWNQHGPVNYADRLPR